MIKIGDFARLSQLSVPTLRHYDEIGLLKPVSVDSLTGYRYYSVAQLPRLNRILALKDLGFSLEQIDLVLTDDLSLDQLRGMLKLKRAEVEQQLVEAQGRLSRIEARLKQIEREDDLPMDAVVLKNIPPLLIASHKITIPENALAGDYLDRAYGEVFRHLDEQGGKAAGPCLAIWHQGAEVLTNEVAEAAVPLDRAIASSDQVQVYELPGAQVVSVVKYGAFENFVQEHTTLLKWIETNGYHITGAYREIYINHNPDNMTESATEIQYPVAKD